ncbi:MAG: Glu-tRNA(Gln) amidotransferase subunit GatE [Thermoproteota archaeon]|nr:Glu-tRNA(Gln) amidotransferase subunit GatE [Thermoproteota archaeon]
MASPLDPGSLNLKVGFEIHQQLATNSKLFCNCRCEEVKEYDSSFVRKLRPTQSELGAYDPAAMFEFSKMHIVKYHSARGSSCLVEADEEPPHDVNKEALEIALIFSLALHSKIMDEIHVMRKIVIDGSNTSGFQRTMLIASGGYLDVAGKRVGVQSICLEEDAAKLIGDEKGVRKFSLDRLGVPLVEIALEPITGKPSEIMQVALTLGRLLRASKRVARGLGSIRQDINISVQNGAVVEVKGVQQLDQMEKIIEYEMHRQQGLIIISQKLREKNIDIQKVGDRAEDVTDILVNKSSSRIIKKVLEAGGYVKAIRVAGFAGMIGYEPYKDVRLGKELGKLVKFYDLDGIFHSDELPNYGITEEEVVAVKQRLQMNDRDAFVILGGPKDKVKFASDAIIQRLKAAIEGVPAETRGATPDGKTVFLRPRPGGARMYPETDILPIVISGSMLASLADKVPKHWDEMVDSLAKKYNLNKKLANQIFDSDYLTVFEEIASETKIEPTFIAAKLTEDLTSLQRQGLDASLLTDQMIKDIFTRLDKGFIPKESVASIFEKLMKNEPIISKSIPKRELRSTEREEEMRATIVDSVIEVIGATSISDEELSKGLDRIINNNMNIIKEKGMNALSTLMGRAMAEYRGKANGQKVNSMLKDKMSKMVNN